MISWMGKMINGIVVVWCLCCLSVIFHFCLNICKDTILRIFKQINVLVLSNFFSFYFSVWWGHHWDSYWAGPTWLWQLSFKEKGKLSVCLTDLFACFLFFVDLSVCLFFLWLIVMALSNSSERIQNFSVQRQT